MERGDAPRHPPRRCFESEPFVVYAVRLGDNAGCRNLRTHGLNTTNVGFSRDLSFPVATGCYSVQPDGSACPLMFWVHSLNIAKVSDTSFSSVIRWFFEADFGSDAGSPNFRLRGLNTAGQCVAQCLPRRCFGNEPPALYDARFGDDAALNFFSDALLEHRQ